MDWLHISLQVLVGLGLLNVWLLRSGSETDYRGGKALTLRQEFAEYGLSDAVFFVVGALKIGSALALLAGIWLPGAVTPAAGLVVLLMLGALSMHLKIGDPWKRSVPAFLMLLMSGTLVFLTAA